MKILPALTEVKTIASDKKYNVLPVSLEILSDFTTPIETMKILKNVCTHCYMFESAQANETWGRYTFLGFDPKMEITCIDCEMKIGNIKVKTGASFRCPPSNSCGLQKSPFGLSSAIYGGACRIFLIRLSWLQRAER